MIKSLDFFLAGNNLAADFGNTVYDPAGEPAGAIRAWPDVLRFCEQTGALSPSDLATQREYLSSQVGSIAGTLVIALRLRDDIRRLLESLRDGSAVSAADVETINRILQSVAGHRMLVTDGSGWKLVEHVEKPGPLQALLPIALDAAMLAQAGTESHVHKCANPNCPIFFRDTANRRNWCSMALCGNRAKVAAHARRQKQNAGA